MALFAVSLPAVWAVFTALYQLDTLVEKNTDATISAKRETLLSRSIAEHLTSMERSANQFRILGDSSLRQVYISNRNQFRSELAVFLQNGPDSRRFTLGERLLKSEAILFEMLKKESKNISARAIEEQTTKLYDLAKNLIARTDALLAQQNELLTREAGQLKQDLVTQAFSVVPFTMTLGIFFFIIITKPIRELYIAIHSLGRGDLDKEINIAGPDDLRELGIRLNELRNSLREVEHQKQSFLRNISHELKTPLTSIREGSSLLCAAKWKDAPEEQEEIIRIIETSSTKLQYLIESLLRFNELTSTSTELEMIKIPELVHSLVSSHRLVLEKKSICIAEDIEAINIFTNRHRISLIVDNLLSNAIRFSPMGGIINIDIKKRDENLSIKIQDRGPGVSRIDTPHIYELFYRGAKQPQNELSGSGLGLAITKEIVDRFNGSIKLEETSIGASFSVHLPICNDGGFRFA